MKHTEGPLQIRARVMPSGGVVILNGPFPLDQANRIKILCEAAPAMLEALKKVLHVPEYNLGVGVVAAVKVAIALAESEGGE